VEYQTCQLPGGYWDTQGHLHKEAVLTPLCGREEELLATRQVATTAALATQVLSRCVQRLGPIYPVTEEITRSLCIGDRQYLLLRLRILTFGDRLQATVPCPWPDCSQSIDIDFQLSQLPVKSSEHFIHTVTLPENRIVQFRLPNGADQELLSPLLDQNEAETLTSLLHRCIQKLDDVEHPSLALIQTLTPLDRLTIERHMEAAMPGVDLTLQANCPECGRNFLIPFDLQDFFFGELNISQDLLRREVHYLAYHYHWSEQDILSMSRHKRRHYIEILAEEIERLNDAME